jgi:CRISPR-associated protein Cmr2
MQSWDDLLLAYLHDPPDKALDIRGHAQRACRYASAAVGAMVTANTLDGLSDQLASITERVPAPTAGDQGQRAVGPRHGGLTVFHPLSGERSTLAVSQTDEDAVQRTIAEIVAGLDTPRDRFLAVWRLLPQKLAAVWPWSTLLPADARVPDHTIWHHLDTSAGFKAANSGPHGAGLLSFTLGPVHSFVESARSVRDLWSGSMILSWLTFQGILPIVEQLGPSAIMYPSLRGIPLADLWLQGRTAVGRKLASSNLPRRNAACLPNRFLAVVPWGARGSTARELAGQCETAARDGWKRLATAVHDLLNPRLQPISATWDKRWEDQIRSYFEIHTATIPMGGAREDVEPALAALWGKPTFAEAFPQAANVRKLADAIPNDECPHYLKRSNPARTNLSGLWQAQVELAARLMGCQRSIRHLPPPSAPSGSVPPKCSLTGSYEQMGPDSLDDSRSFWEKADRTIRGSADAARLRRHERLCAVALVKRFAGATSFARELGLGREALGIPDTATIAASKWLADARELGFSIDVDNGQCLHWTKPNFDENEPPLAEAAWQTIEAARKHPQLGTPPAYFAVLALNGDNMGGWLRGENAPALRDVLHPDLRDYFAGLPGTAAGLDAPRPVGPALHAAFSQALANFAVHVAPCIVESHLGLLVYCGGGDLLALLPSATALACAHELRLAFSGNPRANGGARSGYYRDNGQDLLVMGARATASAGLAMVHYQEDLRFALATAREALKSAKDAGQDLLQVVACRRSGMHAAAFCPWEFVGTVQTWIEAFTADASDRWAYQLCEELPTLKGLSHEAVLAEIRRHVGRMDKPTRDALPPDDLAAAFDTYRRAMLADARRPLQETVSRNEQDRQLASAALESFVALCHTASFLARGGE